MSNETSTDFAAEIFGDALDLSTTCEVAGETCVRYADDQWRGWIPLADLRLTKADQDELKENARKAADFDTDYDPEIPMASDVWANSYLRWLWQLLHDRTAGTEDAFHTWGAVFGDRLPRDVIAESDRAGETLEGWVTKAVSEARSQGAGLRPDVVGHLVEEVHEMLGDE